MNTNNQFALLTLIVIIVVIFVIHDKTLAVLMIGALIGYYFAICTSDKKQNSSGGHLGVEKKVEHFSSAPVHTNHELAINQPLKEEKYLGNIDFDSLDTLKYIADNFNEKDTEKDTEHDEQANEEVDHADAKNIGVSHTRNDACVDYQANRYPMNADERTTQNQLARNDPTKSIAGSIRNRQSQASKYTREEMDQSEARPWWGRSEQ